MDYTIRSSSKKRTQPRIIIHGGAGNITREHLPPDSYAAYRKSLLKVLRSTADRLSDGAEALDAAAHAVVQLENNPLFNCGHGAVFTREGTIELEASVMVSRGYRKRGVGVSLLKHVKNPILLAREMLRRGEEDSDSSGAQGHSQISGKVAEHLAEGWDLEMCDEKYHWTRKRWEEHKRGLEDEGKAEVPVLSWPDLVGSDMDHAGEPGWDGHEYLPQGTVGCVVLDQYGVLCVATSTGGITNKLPGRIGDTPTIGAGFWAEEWAVPSPSLLGNQQKQALSPLHTLLPASIKTSLVSCLPHVAHHSGLMDDAVDEERDYDHGYVSDSPRSGYSDRTIHAAAISGTGNGDSFLRMDAARTAIAASRFAPANSLTRTVTWMAGPHGELQRSAGDRWGKTGEGEGGMIGIESVNDKGTIVADFNCGGMFRAWIDDAGRERMMVFRDEYR